MREPLKTRILPLSIGGIPVRELLLIIPLGALLTLPFVGLHYLSDSRFRDQEGAAIHRGSGTVTRIGFAPRSSSSGLQPAFLELDGRLVNLNMEDSRPVLRLQAGQRADYTYRVGRSGAWYIEQIAPANPAEPAQLRDRR
jgi:hypothetical protein